MDGGGGESVAETREMGNWKTAAPGPAEGRFGRGDSLLTCSMIGAHKRINGVRLTMTGSARIGNVAIQFLRRFTEGGEKMLAQFKDKYAARHAD